MRTRKQLIALVGSVVLGALTVISLAAWKVRQRQAAITHYQEMTNAYQRTRVDVVMT
jgi:hypothetical protein